MKMVQEGQDRLIVRSRPRVARAIVVGMGALALGAVLYEILIQGRPVDVDSAFGLVLGPIFVVGGIWLYRETTTVFDRRTSTVTWTQRGLGVDRRETTRFDEIQDVVIGRPVSEQSGAASRVVLRLPDRSLPLMFGFTSSGRDREIQDAIREFIASDRESAG